MPCRRHVKKQPIEIYFYFVSISVLIKLPFLNSTETTHIHLYTVYLSVLITGFSAYTISKGVVFSVLGTGARFVLEPSSPPPLLDIRAYGTLQFRMTATRRITSNLLNACPIYFNNNILYVHTGLVPKRQSEVEKEHHETGEQPSDDQFHGEPEPEHAVRSRSDQRAHAGLAGSELCRPVLSPVFLYYYCRVRPNPMTRRLRTPYTTTTPRIVHNYVYITNYVRCLILSHNQINPSPSSPQPRRAAANVNPYREPSLSSRRPSC